MSTATYYSTSDADETIYVGRIKSLKMLSTDKKKDYELAYTHMTKATRPDGTLLQVAIIETQTSTNTSDQTPVIDLTRYSSYTIDLNLGLIITEEDFKVESDDKAAITAYEYDAEGRLTRFTEYKNSSPDVQRTETYAYTYYTSVPDDFNHKNIVLITSPAGLKTKNYYDYRGLLTNIWESSTDGSAYSDVRAFNYSVVGLLHQEIKKDKVKDKFTGFDVPVTTTTTYDRDYARDIIQITEPDGLIKHFSQDKVLNTKSYNEGTNTTSIKTTYNNFGLVTKVERILSNSTPAEVLEQYEYDGIGRKTKFTNSQGGITNYSYDNYDRLIKESVLSTAYNVNCTDTDYSYNDTSKNNMLLVTGISYYNVTPTENTKIVEVLRTFDGFGRLLTEQDTGTDSGNAFTKAFDYATALLNNPTSISSTEAPTEKITATYNEYTKAVTSINSVTSSAISNSSSYTYDDKKTGLVKTGVAKYISSTGGSEVTSPTITYTYDNRGMLIETTSTYNTTPTSVVITKTMSTNGQYLLSASNHLGFDQKYYYDSRGRLLSKIYFIDNIAYPNIKIELDGTYNSDGTLNQIQVVSEHFTSTANSTNIMAQLDFTYDNALLSEIKLDVAKSASSTAVTNIYSSKNEYANGLINTATNEKEDTRDSGGGTYTPRIEKHYTYESDYISVETAQEKR